MYHDRTEVNLLIERIQWSIQPEHNIVPNAARIPAAAKRLHVARELREAGNEFFPAIPSISFGFDHKASILRSHKIRNVPPKRVTNKHGHTAIEHEARQIVTKRVLAPLGSVPQGMQAASIVPLGALLILPDE
jgi:hypothetical protein